MSRNTKNSGSARKQSGAKSLRLVAVVLAAASLPAIGAESQIAASQELAQFSRFGIALIFVIFLIFALAWFAKKFNITSLTRNNSEQLKVVAALPVGTRERVVMVEADGQKLLLGITADRINTPHTFADSTATEQSSFAKTLQDTVAQPQTGNEA